MSDGGRRCHVRRGQNGENGDLRPAAVKHRTGRLCMGGGVCRPHTSAGPPPRVSQSRYLCFLKCYLLLVSCCPAFLTRRLQECRQDSLFPSFPHVPAHLPACSWDYHFGSCFFLHYMFSWLPMSHRRFLSLTLQALQDLAPAFPVQLHLVILQTPARLPPPSTPTYPFVFLEGCRTLSFLEPFQCIII